MSATSQVDSRHRRELSGAEHEIYALRLRRFTAVLRHLKDTSEVAFVRLDGSCPDPLSLPSDADGCVKMGRWALLVRSRDRMCLYLGNLAHRQEVEDIAADRYGDGLKPVAFYDLDQPHEPHTEADDRLPQRFDLAGVRVVVVFNDTPAPS